MLQKTQLVLPDDTGALLRQCHAVLFRSGNTSEDVVLDMVRLLIAKLEDERQPEPVCRFGITAEEHATAQGRARACARVRALFAHVRDRDGTPWSPNETISATDMPLAAVISELQGYTVLHAAPEVLGVAYETYLAGQLKAERGQYFTNRLVARALLRMLGPTAQDTVVDPACGYATRRRAAVRRRPGDNKR